MAIRQEQVTNLVTDLAAKASIDVLSTLTYAATTNLDFNNDNIKTLTLTGNVTFTTSNKAAIKQKVIRIIGDSSARTFTFPVGWVFIGSGMPASIATGKTAILSLYCFGSNETDIVAAYSVQP
jgi:predicted nucleotide-binding protein